MKAIGSRGGVVVALLLAGLGAGLALALDGRAEPKPDATKVKIVSNGKYTKPADAELRAQADAAAVRGHAARRRPSRRSTTPTGTTTRPVSTSTWSTGEPLFSSTRQVRLGHRLAELHPAGRGGAASLEKTRRSHGMARTEVRSQAGDSHLGHVFDDGPAPTRPALLHQLGVAALRPGGEAGGGGLRRVPRALRRRPATGAAKRDGQRRGAAATRGDGGAGGRLLLGHGGAPAQDPRRARDRGRLHRRQTSTRPTRTCTPARPATPRRCAWSSTRRSSPTRTCSRSGSSACTTRPRANRQGNDVGHPVPLGDLRDLARSSGRSPRR